MELMKNKYKYDWLLLNDELRQTAAVRRSWLLLTHDIRQTRTVRRNLPFLLLLLLYSMQSHTQGRAVMQIKTTAVKNTVSPSLHGIFFEEISHGGEGGIYGELIQNRGFEESRIPPGTTLEDGFIVPKRTPHYNMNGRATNWKMPWPVKSEWPYWKTGDSANIGLSLAKENPLNAATPNSLEVEITSAVPGK